MLRRGEGGSRDRGKGRRLYDSNVGLSKNHWMPLDLNILYHMKCASFPGSRPVHVINLLFPRYTTNPRVRIFKQSSTWRSKGGSYREKKHCQPRDGSNCLGSMDSLGNHLTKRLIIWYLKTYTYSSIFGMFSSLMPSSLAPIRRPCCYHGFENYQVW